MTEDDIEDHIALSDPDGFEQPLAADSVTSKHLFADGGDGNEKEATTWSHFAGASSEAPASSGIPSAEKQRSVSDDGGYEPTQETQMGRQDTPHKQNVEP